MRSAVCIFFATIAPRAWWAIAAILFLLGAPGCGQNGQTVTVQGTVSYRGEPLTNASIMFFPVSGQPVTATVSSTGQYTANLSPGDYTVVVTLGAQLPPGYKEGDPIPPPKLVLPPQYSTRAKSTIRATVEPGRDQVMDFPLE
jgi:uncharacterized membrane protein